MKQSLSELYKTDPRKACQSALRRTRGIEAKNRLEDCNTLLNGHGTEAIRGSWENGYWCDIVAAYVNMGDAYATTIIEQRADARVCGSSRFVVADYGTFVETAPAELGIQ